MSSSPSIRLLRTQSDERLAALARAGHERAFEAIVERYRKPLLRACRQVLPEARAEDALQHALLAAWTALRRGDEVRELKPWLYRIVRNTALNALRSSGYDHEELLDSLRAQGGAVEEVELRAIVRQTLTGVAALPGHQREALLRTALEGASQADVARDLDVSDGAVRQLVHRARVSLRAAATAATPLSFAQWLGDAGSPVLPFVQRVGELVAGAAPAGMAAVLAKTTVVATLAGVAVTTPVLIDGGGDRPRAAALSASEAQSTSIGGDSPVSTAGALVELVEANRRPAGSEPVTQDARNRGRGEFPGKDRDDDTPRSVLATGDEEEDEDEETDQERGERPPAEGSNAPAELDSGGPGSRGGTGDREPGEAASSGPESDAGPAPEFEPSADLDSEAEAESSSSGHQDASSGPGPGPADHALEP